MAFTIFKNGKMVDLDAIRLPDGRHARSLSRDELEHTLREELGLTVPIGAGRDTLVQLYHQHQKMWEPPVERR